MTYRIADGARSVRQRTPGAGGVAFQHFPAIIRMPLTAMQITVGQVKQLTNPQLQFNTGPASPFAERDRGFSAGKKIAELSFKKAALARHPGYLHMLVESTNANLVDLRDVSVTCTGKFLNNSFAEEGLKTFPFDESMFYQRY